MTASAFFTAILAHLLLFCVHVNATYYCIPPIAAIQTAQPGCIPAPSGAAPFTYYTSVKACCSTDHQSVIGATSAVKTYDNVPPEALPDNCNLAVSLRNGVHECQPGETHGFLNWAPASSASSTASIDLPAICCRDDIRLLPEYASAIQVAVNIPQRGIPSPGGGIGGIPGGGIIQPTTVVPRPAIRPAPIPAGGPSQACRDLNVPGQAYSDCPAFLYRCDDPMWRSVMQQQCRFTCKLCGTGAAANGVGVARQQSPVAGNGRICRDWIGPSGHVTCAQMVSNGLCLTDRTRMRAQCRFSCGLC